MHGWVTFLSALVIAAAAGSVEARIPRSSSAVTAFKRANPCPVNGAMRGPCPGHEVDHIEPLCAGGPDTPANMAAAPDAETARYVLYFADELGAIRRLKKGNSYLVFSTGSGPDLDFKVHA